MDSSIARQADPLDLYQRAVQQPDEDIRLFDRFFRRVYGRTPKTLREDFCGTAAVATAWVRSRRDRTARAVDLDARVLAWGAIHNQLPLDASVRGRLQLIQGDVRNIAGPRVDIVVAQNFSFCTFKAREDLLRYFRAARRALHREGIIVLDVLGGYETQREDRREVRRERGGFTYVWEQNRFDPITQRALFSIHFRFADGSEMKNAFTYDWRLWTIPEIRELLSEAGFRRSAVYWEHDRSGRGSGGSWRRCESAPSEAVWIAMIVGIR